MIKNIFKPLFRANPNKRTFKVFLAGSIEMGEAEDWQAYATEKLGQVIMRDIEVFNPRRDAWNPDWKQEFENAEFNQQVNWELNNLDRADLIIMNLLPGTKSPISLLELGLYAKSGKVMVVCPKEFWRSGNVQVVCDRFNIPLYENLDDLLNNIIIQNDLVL